MTIGATTMPLEVALALGGLVGGAAFLLFPVLTNLDDVSNLLTTSGYQASGLGLLVLLLVVAGAAAGLGYVAYRVFKRDPLARALSFIAAGSVIAGVLLTQVAQPRYFAFTTGLPASWIVATLLLAAALFFLAFSDPARAWVSARAPQPVPAPIAIATTTALVAGLTLVAAGAAMLLLTKFRNSEVQGVLLIATGGVTVGVYRSVQAGNQQMRIVLTVLMGLGFLLALANDIPALGVKLNAGLAAGVLYYLWGPPESRAYFDQQAGD